MSFSPDGYVLGADEGPSLWFLNTLAIVKARGEETRGGLTVIENLCPPGFAAPPHVHRDEEEAFYVLSGELRIRCGEGRWTGGPGSFALLPRGIEHAFSVPEDGDPAKVLVIASPAGFEGFVAEAGEEASEPRLPEPSEPDPGRLAEMASRHGIEILGPPEQV